MRHSHAAAITLSTVVLVASAACGGDSKPTTSKPGNDGFTEGVVTPKAAQTLQFGQPGEVAGENGGKLRITPVSVLYHRGPYTSGLEGPENGWFVVVGMRAEAVGGLDGVAAPTSNGGLRWRGGGETIWSGQGNASSTPWVGAVTQIQGQVQPGEPSVGIETFDVPSRTGGKLVYINPGDQSEVSWTLPSADTGSLLLGRVRARIKKFT